MKAHIAPVTAQNPHDLFESFAETLESVRDTDALVRAGFAYATLGGVQQFISHVDAIGNWEGIRKEFMIGIHHAITEPSALENLRRITHSQVRVYVPGRRLGATALVAKPVFHPKVLAISTEDGGNLRMVQTGSTNMTSSAIGCRPQNYEFSLAILAESDASLDQNSRFDTWWLSLWAESRRVDRRFIRNYAELRKRVLDQNPILRSEVEAPPGIGDVESFFCEVGAGSGPPGSRHQIEFPEALARFFGQVERRRRGITLKRGED